MNTDIGYNWKNPKHSVNRIKTNHDELAELLRLYAYLCETTGSQSERTKRTYLAILKKFDKSNN